MRNEELPFAFGAACQFGLDHPNQSAAGLVESLGELEDRAERGLLLTEFEDADIRAAQLGLKAKPFLRQTCLLAQLTENSSKGNRWLQISLPLLEELSRKRTIVSSYSYGNCRLPGRMMPPQQARARMGFGIRVPNLRKQNQYSSKQANLEIVQVGKYLSRSRQLTH